MEFSRRIFSPAKHVIVAKIGGVHRRSLGRGNMDNEAPAPDSFA